MNASLWYRLTQKGKFLPLLMAIATAFAILLVTWAFDTVERTRYQQQVREHVTEHLNNVRLRLEQAIQQRHAIAQAIASYILINKNQLSDTDFHAFLTHLLADSTQVSQIRFYQQQQLRHTYPQPAPTLTTNEQHIITETVKQPQLWIAGPVEQSPQAHFILFFPIAHASTSHDVLALLIPRRQLLAEAGIQQADSKDLAFLYQQVSAPTELIYTLVGRDGLGPSGGVFFGSPQLFARGPMVTEVRLPHGEWRVASLPAQGWPTIAPISIWLWTIGLTLALFGSILIFTLFNAPRQLRQSIAQATQHIMKLNEAYERFVPSGFLKLLHKDSVIHIALGDQTEREMTVLFSDIRNFTSISEQLSPRENFDYVNHYLGQMEPIIIKHKGLIDKYIGDAIMVLFPTQPDNALSCAISMLNELKKYNNLLKTIDYPLVKIGIGLNTGTLMLGIIGGQTRLDSTVIGDTVNLSARVENLTKVYGVPLLITEHTYHRLIQPDNYHIRAIDRVTVKGKSIAVTVYEVYDADVPELIALKAETQATFELAMQQFQQEQFREALKNFETVALKNPEDSVAAIYVRETRKILTLTEQQTPLILVVDDVQMNLTIMYEILSHNGFEVLVANSGMKALEMMKYSQPHLVLLDIMMPELDGFEVCRRLKSNVETQDIPVIFTTALSDIADKIKGFDVGAVDYITKPFQAAEVLARLRTHLTVHQLKQRLLARSENLQVHNLALKKKIEMLSHQT